MSIGMWLLYGLLLAISYGATPFLLVHGWFRWARNPKAKSLTASLSANGFILATASAAWGLLTVAYAHVHHFGFYDPQLMKIEGTGIILSLAGLLIAAGGTFKKNFLRWHAPLAAFGTLVFWLLAASFE